MQWPGQVPAWALLGLSAVGAIAYGVKRYQPDSRPAWWLLGSGVLLFITGGTASKFWHQIIGRQNVPFPSFIDGIHLTMYLAFAAGLLILARAQTADGDRASLLDGLTITLGVGVLFWVFLIGPAIREPGGLIVRLIGAAYPLGDVLVLAMLVRLWSAGGMRYMAGRLLALGTSGVLVSDSLYELARLHQGWNWNGGNVVDLGWIVFCACVGAAALHQVHWLSFSVLILSRLALGVGESLGSTGATLWGITSAGHEHTAKVIGLNGISTYGGMALAAPLGVILDQQWGLKSIGLLTIMIGAVSFVIAWRKEPVPVEPGEHMPFTAVLGRVAPHGMGLALAGVSYSVLATFVTLFYANRHWTGAALCLSMFGIAFIAVRLLFIKTISTYGGFPVAIASLLVVSVGMVLLWQASSAWMALAGAGFGGLGLSLVFPAIGVEAVKRVPEFSRGTALGVYTAFSDVSFFLVGPVAGAIIGFYGYASVFLFALISVLVALGIVIVLKEMQSQRTESREQRL